MNRTRDDIALLLLRLSGLMLAAYHGIGKVKALAAGQMPFVEGVTELGLPYPLLMAWAAALSESLGGLLVALGLWTRVGAAFGAFTVGMAAFGRHHAHEQILSAIGLRPIPEETIKSWGRPELALMYFLVLVALVIAGPGRFALGRALGRGRRT